MIKIEYDNNGKIIHNGHIYTAIQELHDKLIVLGISHEIHEMFDGYQICVPAEHNPNEFEGDAIQHFGSYGAVQNLIEVYGFELDEPAGYLTADEALKYFIKWNSERE